MQTVTDSNSLLAAQQDLAGTSNVTPPVLLATESVAQHAIHDAVVMIVDDEVTTIEAVRAFLEDVGYRNFITCSDGPLAMATIAQEQPDVLLLDLVMPGVSGFDILSYMRADSRWKHIPVIILTASTDAETKLKTLELGATDLLSKPVDASELALRIKNALSSKAYHDHLTNYSAMLEDQVRLRTAELKAAQHKIIQCLARAGEYRDHQTGMHVIRVGRYAGVIARQLGFNRDRIELIEQAAQLHDIGKIGVSGNILLKPGCLDPDEFERVKEHCQIGEHIIEPIASAPQTLRREQGQDIVPAWQDSPIMRMASIIAETHHERWDGSGYPKGLKGDSIPVEGRITAVADVYDALSSKRPYKDAYPREKCLQILRDSKGTHFDPIVVEAFFAGTDDILKIQADFAG